LRFIFGLEEYLLLSKFDDILDTTIYFQTAC